jgi:hypothetical protein
MGERSRLSTAARAGKKALEEYPNARAVVNQKAGGPPSRS